MEAPLPIVVGNDGSDFARLAVHRALWLGQQLKAPVRIVRAWSISTAPRPATWSPGYVPPADDFEAAVRQRLERDVAGQRAEFPEVEVILETPHGPPGRELLSEYEANGIASVLAGLKFDDVAKAESAVPDPASTVSATFQTFDGLVVEITGFASEGKRYASFKASVDPARADLAAKAAQLNALAEHERAQKGGDNTEEKAEGKPAAAESAPLAVTDPVAFVAERRKSLDDEAAALNRIAQGWVYVLPAYKYANMDKRLEDLLKPKA